MCSFYDHYISTRALVLFDPRDNLSYMKEQHEKHFQSDLIKLQSVFLNDVAVMASERDFSETDLLVFSSFIKTFYMLVIGKRGSVVMCVLKSF